MQQCWEAQKYCADKELLLTFLSWTGSPHTKIDLCVVDHGGAWFSLPKSGYSAVPNAGDMADQLPAAWL